MAMTRKRRRCRAYGPTLAAAEWCERPIALCAFVYLLLWRVCVFGFCLYSMFTVCGASTHRWRPQLLYHVIVLRL